MCTLTYLPKGEKHYLLTSNRDEGYQRKVASPPTFVQRKYAQVFCPIDEQAHGTWLATGSNGLTCCVLNGAFELHKRKLPYRLSRGIMVMQLFDYPNPYAFLKEYDLDNIEPFTLVLFYQKATLEIIELKWDGQKKHIKTFDASQPHIWSAATLFDADARGNRCKWFAEWLNTNPGFERENIIQFHQTEDFDNGFNSIKMDRKPFVRTVSTTSLNYDFPNNISFKYMDYVNGQSHFVQAPKGFLQLIT